jgi:hypothetical protein
VRTPTATGAVSAPERVAGTRHVLVVADSLAFHGPERAELLTDPRLFPQVAATALSAGGARVTVDVVARVGWTSRDAWWALTRDPYVYSVLLPRADAVLLAVGSMDYLPTAVPTWLREGIRYLRPPLVRRAVRRAYRWAQPRAAAATPWRVLPQRLTDTYLTYCCGGVRHFHPGVPVLGILPAPHRAASYGSVARPSARGHALAVAAARAWGRRNRVPMVDLPRLVGPHLAAGRANPDGMHFGWEAHAAVGAEVARLVERCRVIGKPAGTDRGSAASEQV